MMKKFLLAAMMLAVPSMAHAQMGPAGPPGGGGQTVQSNGDILFYQGQNLNNDTAIGKGLTIVYVPSPTYNGPAISYVHYYTLAGAPAGTFPANFNAPQSTTLQPADPMQIRVVADAYDAYGNIVDSCITPKFAIWRPPFKISLDSSPTGSVNGNMNFMSVPFTVTVMDAFGDSIGPGGRWESDIEYSWDSNNTLQKESDTYLQYGDKRTITPSMSWATYFRMTSGQTTDDGKVIDTLSLRIRFLYFNPDNSHAGTTDWYYKTFKLKRQSEEHWILIPGD